LKKNKKNYKIKIGILGGTFDPPHKGHLHISKVALKKLKLKKVLWVITRKNPFKNKPYLNIRKRIELSKKITENNKKINIKFFDARIKSINTYNLLRYLKNNMKAELFFLMGVDNLKKFHKWKNWEQIPKFAKIVVFPRKNFSINSVASKKLDKKNLIFIKSKKINISSSIIRKFW